MASDVAGTAAFSHVNVGAPILSDGCAYVVLQTTNQNRSERRVTKRILPVDFSTVVSLTVKLVQISRVYTDEFILLFIVIATTSLLVLYVRLAGSATSLQGITRLITNADQN